MVVAEKDDTSKALFLRANIICYGDAADDMLANKIATDISRAWNNANAAVKFKDGFYRLVFEVQGFFEPGLRPEDVFENDNPLSNYFRIEKYVMGDISFVDGIGSNTGYFKLDNLLNDSTTAAHEFGHTIGLSHPEDLDIRHADIPGIMYPRGTLVKAAFQYDPSVPPASVGGTLNPIHRKVLKDDIALLKLDKLRFVSNRAIVGAFSSVWHNKDLPA